MKTGDFDYVLPEDRIAQQPCSIRDECRLLVMGRETGALSDRSFRDIIDYIEPGDLLVANETRVMPARLLGTKKDTGGGAEVFLLRQIFDPVPPSNTEAVFEALVRPGRRLKPGAVIEFHDAAGTCLLEAEIVDWVEHTEKGGRLVRLSTTACETLDDALHRVGRTPLPPYIKNYQGNDELYQTVFSREEKSAAAPTAGLHFTPKLIEDIKAKGAYFETVELEVGLDTFRIVDEDDPHDHHIHTELYTVPQFVVDAVDRTHSRGNKVIAVGTTSVRSLESAWDPADRRLRARHHDTTSLYLLPGSEFHVVDALITNFHVPRSTLMMLVSAFSTREHIMEAYQHALRSEYRFLSFGDAMFIV